MQIINKSSRIIVKIPNATISIPSPMYPLESENFRLFTESNTSEITDKNIINIFDSLEFQLGRCFTNSEKLYNALREAGYPAEQYVGWVFTGNELPVHHSFVVLDNHILDTTISFLSQDIEKLSYINLLPQQQQREKLADYYLSQESLPNHEKRIFGAVDPMYLYIGAPGTAAQGIQRNKELRTVYPNHPCFQNVKGNSTKLQDVILQKK